MTPTELPEAAVTRLLPGRTVPFAPPTDPWRALGTGWVLPGSEL